MHVLMQTTAPCSLWGKQSTLCYRSEPSEPIVLPLALSLAHYFSIDLFAEDYGCVSDPAFRLDNKPFQLLVG